MQKKDSENFKKLFKELEDKTKISLEKLDLSKLYSADEWDHVQEDRDKLLEFKLASRHKFFLKKIKGQLEKLEQGTFGSCEDCDGEIELSRLYARPTATMCISCKEEQEKEENTLQYEKRSKTYAKGFSNQANTLYVNGEEVLREKVIQFNKERAKIGLA